ncbi:hypothetical protein H4582DRAFT_1909310 [Lactarius indigo]|nr:hypothetical protein H4582DRAFT_1909310 [Lactarius indigo]
MSSVPSTPSLGPPSTKLFGEHWKRGHVKTHLPFRKFVAGDISLKSIGKWVVVISRMVRCPILFHKRNRLCAPIGKREKDTHYRVPRGLIDGDRGSCVRAYHSVSRLVSPYNGMIFSMPLGAMYNLLLDLFRLPVVQYFSGYVIATRNKAIVSADSARIIW